MGLTVGVAKDGAKDGEGDGVVKESAKGDEIGRASCRERVLMPV